jgi:hypothetical protein
MSDQKNSGAWWIIPIITALVFQFFKHQWPFEQRPEQTSPENRQAIGDYTTGYAKGYEEGKKWGKKAVEDSRLVGDSGNLSDPWVGNHQLRLLMVETHGLDYVNGYELGYNKGFHDFYGY